VEAVSFTFFFSFTRPLGRVPSRMVKKFQYEKFFPFSFFDPFFFLCAPLPLAIGCAFARAHYLPWEALHSMPCRSRRLYLVFRAGSSHLHERSVPASLRPILIDLNGVTMSVPMLSAHTSLSAVLLHRSASPADLSSILTIWAVNVSAPMTALCSAFSSFLLLRTVTNRPFFPHKRWLCFILLPFFTCSTLLKYRS